MRDQLEVKKCNVRAYAYLAIDRDDALRVGLFVFFVLFVRLWVIGSERSHKMDHGQNLAFTLKSLEITHVKFALLDGGSTELGEDLLAITEDLGRVEQAVLGVRKRDLGVLDDIGDFLHVDFFVGFLELRVGLQEKLIGRKR